MEIINFLTWYLYLVIFGIIGFPLANYLFKNFWDKGYVFAKILGLLLATLPLWLLSSLGIVQFNTVSSFVSLLICFALSLFLMHKYKIRFEKKMLYLELILFVVMVVLCYIRSANPQVEGTEKFMNLAIMNSVDRTLNFPPKDMWYSGFSINYYYLGHYLFVFFNKITNVGMNYAYNYALITLAGLSFTGLISIFKTLTKAASPKVSAFVTFIGSTWIIFGGNMHYFIQYLYSNLLNQKFEYFFTNPVRIIPFTINDYPSYSIVLGDLHGNYIALPFLIMIIAIAFSMLKLDRSIRKSAPFYLVVSFITFALYGINSWDFLTANFVFGLINLYRAFKYHPEWKQKVKSFVMSEVILLLPGLLFFLPYIINFRPAVGGIGFVPMHLKSPIGPWLLMWGMFILITGIYGVLMASGMLKRKLNRDLIFAFVLTLSSLALIFAVEVIFVKDIFAIYNPDYSRANTVFKFHYHAWVIWGIASTYFIYRIIKDVKVELKSVANIAIGIILVAYLGSIAYFFKAVYDFYPQKELKDRTMDGYAFIYNQSIGDYYALQWIRENIQGQPVIAEAVGEAYTFYSRVTATTGLVTPIGWPTHELQWRNVNDEIYARKDDIDKLYKTTDKNIFDQIIKKFNIEYIYVGDKEREAYTDQLNEKIINEKSELIYNENNTRIYRLKK